MKRTLWISLVCAVLLALPAAADWQPGDPHKQANPPQLPDPNGWDVDITHGWIADDWQCGETGPVTDIHFWYSWQGDNIGVVDKVDVNIWSDMPAGDPNNPYPWSRPRELLWQRQFLPGQFQIAGPWEGSQGWMSPEIQQYNRPDHNLYFQINITDIVDPFQQERGNIYWLELHIHPENAEPGQIQPIAGWKTSLIHWNDDAVYHMGPTEWLELTDPLTGDSLDLAFVITPEPATLLLLGAGAAAMLRRRTGKRE